MTPQFASLREAVLCPVSSSGLSPASRQQTEDWEGWNSHVTLGAPLSAGAECVSVETCHVTSQHSVPNICKHHSCVTPCGQMWRFLWQSNQLTSYYVLSRVKQWARVIVWRLFQTLQAMLQMLQFNRLERYQDCLPNWQARVKVPSPSLNSNRKVKEEFGLWDASKILWATTITQDHKPNQSPKFLGLSLSTTSLGYFIELQNRKMKCVPRKLPVCKLCRAQIFLSFCLFTNN